MIISGAFTSSPLGRLSPAGFKGKVQDNAEPSDGVSLSIPPGDVQADSKSFRPGLKGQARLALAIAISVVGASGAVLSADFSPKQAEVQVKQTAAEAIPTLSFTVQQQLPLLSQSQVGQPWLAQDGWLFSGSAEKEKLPEPAPFHLSEPSVQKGDYVAHGVNFSQLLSDAEFTDTTAVSGTEIQAFLESKNSFLADFKVDSLSASQMIVQVAQEEGVNPWVLVTTLEKENSMVSRQTRPKQRVMNAAMGYGHTDGGNRNGKDNNFEKQIRRGAGLLRELACQSRPSFSWETTAASPLHRLTLSRATHPIPWTLPCARWAAATTVFATFLSNTRRTRKICAPRTGPPWPKPTPR